LALSEHTLGIVVSEQLVVKFYLGRRAPTSPTTSPATRSAATSGYSCFTEWGCIPIGEVLLRAVSHISPSGAACVPLGEVLLPAVTQVSSGGAACAPLGAVLLPSISHISLSRLARTPSVKSCYQRLLIFHRVGLRAPPR
jgi:hypothetical protein